MLELKVARKGKKSPAAALREGLAQIRARGYDTELLAAGASTVHAFAAAFDGKRVWVAAAKPAATKPAAAKPRRRGQKKPRRTPAPRGKR